MILIIDDDHAVRTSLLLLLQQEGYASKGVSSPNEAMAWLNHNEPSLIILDLNFSIETSGEEGIKLLNQIRKIHPIVPGHSHYRLGNYRTCRKRNESRCQ